MRNGRDFLVKQELRASQEEQHPIQGQAVISHCVLSSWGGHMGNGEVGKEEHYTSLQYPSPPLHWHPCHPLLCALGG